MYSKKKFWSKTLVKKTSKIVDVINSLNKSGLQISIIVDSKKNFVGTITDGDIRRGMLKGLKLSSKITSIINKKSIFSKKKISAINAQKILNKFEIMHLPILNGKKISGLYFNGNNKIDKKLKPNNVVIMAGGFGRRLENLTKKMPKGMLKYYGKPLLEHIIERLKKEGFKNIYISVFYLKDKIINYFDDGKKFDVNIKYLIEKRPMGTIGGLSLLKKKFNESFVVLNCDVITDLNFEEMLKFHNLKKADITMAVKNFTFTNPYGVIKSKNNYFKKFDEKPSISFTINAGIYLFNPNVINCIKSNKIKNIQDLIHIFFKKKKMISTYPMYENWQDFGSNKSELKS